MNRLFLTIACFVITGLSAGEYYVDYNHGKNSGRGTREAPFATFRYAIGRAKPGDTVFILPAGKMIHDTISIRNIHGEKTEPVIVDGMMNTFTGAAQIDEKDWREISPGLFHRSLKTTPGMINRYFLRIGRKQIRMGRKSKFRSSRELLRKEELNEFEWTVENGKDYYFRLPPGKKIRDYSIWEPVLISGAAVSGTSCNVVVRNFIFRDYRNDGLNIHNRSKNILFENTAALFCGDDGASSHNDCEVTIRNFISIGNASGLCHIGNARTKHENIYIAQIDSRDLFLLNSENILENVFIDGSAPGPLEICGVKDAKVCGKVENSIFLNRRKDSQVVIAPEIVCSNLILSGYHQVSARQSGITVCPPSAALSSRLETERKKLFAIFGGCIERELEREF